MVEVFVPVFNNEQTINETLTSLADQTAKQISVHIIDNASTDNTKSICSNFVQNNNNFFYHYFPEHVSAEENFNRCLDRVKASYFSIFHADDVYESTIIEKQLEYMHSGDFSAIATHARIINHASRVIGSKFVPPELKNKKFHALNFEKLFLLILKYGNFIACPSVMISSKYLTKVKPWNGRDYKSSADLDFWLKLSEQAPLAFLNEPLIKYRVSTHSFTVRQAKVRSQRHDFFLVLDAYVKRCNFNDAQSLENYNFLIFKDNILISFALLKKFMFSKKYVIRPFKFSLLSTALSSLFHFKIYFIGLIVAIVIFLLRPALKDTKC